MQNLFDFVQQSGHAICVLLDEAGCPIILFRTVELARQHAEGAELVNGNDYIIVGGFHDAIQALTFANSGIIHALHFSMWGGE